MRDPSNLSSGVGKFFHPVASNAPTGSHLSRYTFLCGGPLPGSGCTTSRHFQCFAIDYPDALHLLLATGAWYPRPADGDPICSVCYLAATRATSPAPVPPPDEEQPLRPADLVTYCDHCGGNLVGTHDTMRDWVELRCPKSKEVKQVLRDRELAEWPEWAMQKVER